MDRPRRTRRKSAPTHGFADRERGVRLQKALADAGVAARRECEELILQGAVTVNGSVVDALPAFVDPAEDRIEVYGRPLRKPEKHVYIALFKPRGTVCTNSDPEGRPRAIDLVQHPERPRLFCVGRLDLDSSGLLVLTNDGDFANILTHPRYGVTKGYDVVVEGSLDAETVAKLEREILADAGNAQRSSLTLLKRERDRTTMHLELCEHRNLQIRTLMLAVGHPVKKLRRTSFGALKLKGLAVGEWRELTSREVEMLRKSGSTSRAAPAAPPKPTKLAKFAAFEGKRRSERAREERKIRAKSPAKPAPLPAPEAAEPVAQPPKRVPAPMRRRDGAERSGERRPERSADRRPERSGERRPERSADRRPERSGERRPERSGERRPERSADRRPERSADRRPERSADRRPERSADRRPERSGERRPERSGERRGAGREPKRGGGGARFAKGKNGPRRGGSR